MKLVKNSLLLSALIFLALFLCGSTANAQAASLTGSFNDNSGDETGFEVHRCTGAGCTNFTLLRTLAANINSFIDATVAEGLTYCYEVRAIKTGATPSAFSNVSCGTAPISPPNAPSNLVVK